MSTIKLRRDTSATWASQDPTLAQGELGYVTDTGDLKIGDGVTAWNSLPVLIPSRVLLAMKETDQTQTSNDTTFVDDTALVLPMAANTRYAFRMVLISNSHIDEDMRARITGPAGASIIYTATAGTSNTTITLDGEYNLTGSGFDRIGVFNGTAHCGGTPGDLKLQWRQQTAGVNGSTLKAGSFIELVKVGAA